MNRRVYRGAFPHSLRASKLAFRNLSLFRLVSVQMGKSSAELHGKVQNAIDTELGSVAKSRVH